MSNSLNSYGCKFNLSSYKLIAFDIDGTIMLGENKLCPKLKEVVSELQKNGYLFTIASARFPASVINIANELGIEKVYNNLLVALNGSLVIDKNRQIHHSDTFKLREETRLQLSKIDSDIAICYYSDFLWICNTKNTFIENEEKIIGVSYTPYRLDIVPNDLNKITLIGDYDKLVQAKHLFHNYSDLSLAFSHDNYLEINSTSSSKLSGLSYIARFNNISLDQVIAFGDGENDINMLSGVGLGVAMANAPQHVKQVAKDIAGFNYDSGVANYLENLMLKEIL